MMKCFQEVLAGCLQRDSGCQAENAMTVVGDRTSMECLCRNMVLRRTLYVCKQRMGGLPRMLLHRNSTA